MSTAHDQDKPASGRAMVIYDMTPEECRKVLGRESSGRLACARRNGPYIVPIEFANQDRLSMTAPLPHLASCPIGTSGLNG